MASKQQTERVTTTPTRQERRFPHLRELSVHYEGSSEDIALRPPDISTRGMFVNTTRQMPEGAVLTLRFRLSRTGYEVRARAEVRYCLPGVGVGVEFVDISPEDRQAIMEELRIAEGGDSRRS